MRRCRIIRPAYLKHFDELCQQSRHTGVSANDAHHNQAFRGRMTDDGKMQLDDALGKKLLVLDPAKVPFIKPMMAGKQPGDLAFELDLDPYERSFRHVSTHLLMKEVTRDSVWEALKVGRAYVSFDWIADPTGFVFRADRGEESWPIGGEVPGAAGVRLRAAAPLSGTFKLVRDGKVIAERTGSTFDEDINETGVYRRGSLAESGGRAAAVDPVEPDLRAAGCDKLTFLISQNAKRG